MGITYTKQVSVHGYIHDHTNLLDRPIRYIYQSNTLRPAGE